MSGDFSTKNVTKFDGKNFQGWKFQMEAVLTAHDIHDVVTGDRAKPNDQNSAEAKTWVKDDAKARFLMSSSMEYDELQNVLTCTTSKAMWDKLSAIHEQKTETNKLFLSQRFHEYRMNPTDTVVQHVSKIQNLARQLLDLGENIPDIQIMAKILASLPAKYRNIRTAWNSVEPTRRTIENLQARLIKEESYLNEESLEVNALAATSRRTEKGVNSSSTGKYSEPKRTKKNIVCYVCGKKGHFARECTQRKQQDSKKEKSYGTEGNFALVYSNQNRSEQGKESVPIKNRPSDEDKRGLLAVGIEDVWLTDSGASAHITYRRDWFVEYHPRRDGSTIVLGDDGECEIAGEGTVRIEKLIAGKWIESQIQNVLHVPMFKKNLLSVGVCTRKGLQVLFQGDGVEILHDKTVVAQGVKMTNEIFRMFIRAPTTVKVEALVAETGLKAWHERLGHLNLSALKMLIAKDIVTGVNVKSLDEFFCEACQLGKAHKLPFKKPVLRATSPGEFVHSDVCGPFSEESLGGSRYYVLFKDDASGYRCIYFMKHKSDVFEVFKNYEKEIRNKFGQPIKVLHTDNGGEYVNKAMKNYLCRWVSLMSVPLLIPQSKMEKQREITEQLSSVHAHY